MERADDFFDFLAFILTEGRDDTVLALDRAISDLAKSPEIPTLELSLQYIDASDRRVVV